MIKLDNIKDFDLKATFMSGQCFRWKENEDGSFFGVVKNNIINIKLENDILYIDGINKNEFDEFYENYFDLSRDYESIRNELKEDNIMCEAIHFSPNMKILNQDFWETLCSFIISQNNNIPRIMTIIENFCKNFGEKLAPDIFSFPSPSKVASLTLDEINVIKAGFRGKYLLDAADKITKKIVDIDKVKSYNLLNAREHLMQIKGVGPKVADCTLLYGASKFDSFPIDVWMKRAISTLYPEGIPEIIKQNAGIAQLYIFNYARLNPSLV